MGFLKSVFAKDWGGELSRGEGFLEDNPVRALEVARRVVRKVDGDLGERARELLSRARAAVRGQVLDKAERAEEEGELADAADWLLAAIEHSPDGSDPELEARRESLLDRLDEAQNPFLERSAGGAVGSTGSDLEITYETLVSMLDEEVADLYEGREEAFQLALVDLNEGRAEAARDRFDPLVAGDPADAVLRLERGRTLLLLGEAQASMADFEVAWESLGEGALDAMGSLTVPGLWAEAALAAGEPGRVVERLDALASPASGSSHLCRLFAEALAADDDPAPAIEYLRAVVSYYPGDVDFARRLAVELARTGDRAQAITLLEAAVAPSCAGGGCGRGPKDVLALRTLATLHLGDGGDPGRAAELMAIVAHAQGGMLAADDHRVLAAYYEASGDPDAADRERGEAERLASLGAEELSPAPRLGGASRVL